MFVVNNCTKLKSTIVYRLFKNDSRKKEKNGAKMKASFQSETQDDSWVWHFIFGHLNFGVLKVIHTKDMVKCFPLI